MYLRIDVLTRTVVLRGVHVHHQRLARYALGGDTGVVGEPVVGVNHVKLTLQVLGYLGCNHSIAGYLLHQVCTILTREGVTLLPAVGRRPDALTRLDILLVVRCVLLRRDVGHHVRVDVDKRDLIQNVVLAAGAGAINGLDITGIHYANKTLVLITVSVRNDERDVHAITCQTASHAVACRSQTSGNVRRKLPAEH